MFISYFDESGDDGYPAYSSELFVLTSIYFHDKLWKTNYENLYKIRKKLYTDYKLPIKQEFHTKEFITDKSPYHGLYPPEVRKKIVFDFFYYISFLDFKTVSVIINKKKIGRPTYDVLRNALTYNVQRIENDLNYIGDGSQFLIITDEGRIGKMRSTTRAIQKINYIPSMYNYDSYRKEITKLIEDPLPKRSSDSYMIQLSDMLCCIISLYAKRQNGQPWSKRILKVFDYGDEEILLNMVKDKLNLKASRNNEFGFVCYPK